MSESDQTENTAQTEKDVNDDSAERLAACRALLSDLYAERNTRGWYPHPESIVAALERALYKPLKPRRFFIDLAVMEAWHHDAPGRIAVIEEISPKEGTE